MKNLLRVGFLSIHKHTAVCPYLRIKKPLLYLSRAKKIEYVDLGEFNDDILNIRFDKFKTLDVLIVQREMPKIISYNDLMRLLGRKKVKIIYEIDDALTGVPQTNPHYRELKEIRPRIEKYLYHIIRAHIPG